MITQKNLDVCEASAEIDSIESELSLKEMEFKNILNFYQEVGENFKRIFQKQQQQQHHFIITK